ncbi:MAG: ADP-ribose pyrophosphatase [Ignavibacteriae bacterium]|nr:MAG: ADP-ribose pyrophosphatase [Ignavibacteriota bacterium]
MNDKWLEWAREIQAISQKGLTYSKDKFDIERFKQLQNVAADILSNYSYLNKTKVKNILTKQDSYATPKVDVRGIVFQNEKILLVKEKSDGKWALPGGWADVNLSASENVEREVWEESGYKVKAVRLMAVYDREKHPHQPKYFSHIYKMFFLCKILSGKPTLNIEIDAIDFFSLEKLPELSVMRITKSQIKRMFELKEIAATDFD